MHSEQDLLTELSFRSGLSVQEVEKELSEFRRTLEESSSDHPVILQGIGSFVKSARESVQGHVGFTPDATLLALVNVHYAGLKPLLVSKADSSPDGSGAGLVPLQTGVESATVHTPKQIRQKTKWPIPLGIMALLLISAVALLLFQNPENMKWLGMAEGPSPTDNVPIQSVDPTGDPGIDPFAVGDSAADSGQTASSEEVNPRYGLFGDFNEELRGSFAISVFSFSDIDNASEQAAVLLTDGYRMHIRSLWRGDSTLWLLTIGQFETREDAEEALKSLSETTFPDSTILQLP